MTLRNIFGLAGGTGSQQTLPYPYIFEFEYCSLGYNAAADSPKLSRGSFVVLVSKIQQTETKSGISSILDLLLKYNNIQQY